MAISFQNPGTASYTVSSFDVVRLFVHQRFCPPIFLTSILAGFYIDRGCAKLIASGKVSFAEIPFSLLHVPYYSQDCRQVQARDFPLLAYWISIR
jgi:hypothetical protein